MADDKIIETNDLEEVIEDELNEEVIETEVLDDETESTEESNLPEVDEEDEVVEDEEEESTDPIDEDKVEDVEDEDKDEEVRSVLLKATNTTVSNIEQPVGWDTVLNVEVIRSFRLVKGVEVEVPIPITSSVEKWIEYYKQLSRLGVVLSYK